MLAGYTGPVCVKSFDPRGHRPGPGGSRRDLLRGIVAESHHADPSYDRLSPKQKHALGQPPPFRGDPAAVHLLAREGSARRRPPYLAACSARLPVMTWTVRTPEDRERARRHADQMVFEGFVP